MPWHRHDRTLLLDWGPCRHVDYYVTDRISTPPEHRGQYSEKLMVLPDFYLCNNLPSSYPDFWSREVPGPHAARLRSRYLLAPHHVSPAGLCRCD